MSGSSRSGDSTIGPDEQTVRPGRIEDYDQLVALQRNVGFVPGQDFFPGVCRYWLHSTMYGVSVLEHRGKIVSSLVNHRGVNYMYTAIRRISVRQCVSIYVHDMVVVRWSVPCTEVLMGESLELLTFLSSCVNFYSAVFRKIYVPDNCDQ